LLLSKYNDLNFVLKDTYLEKNQSIFYF